MEFGLSIFYFLLKTSIIINYQSIAFFQKDYHVIYERALLHYFNPKFYRNVKYEFRFFNRSTKALYWQFELLEDFDETLEFHFATFKMFSNEYRGFPIAVDMNLCTELERSTFGVSDIKKYSNITNCPWKKGFYVVQNFIADENKFPPFIPFGRYKAVLNTTYHSELISEMHIFHEIKGIKKVGNLTVYV